MKPLTLACPSRGGAVSFQPPTMQTIVWKVNAWSSKPLQVFRYSLNFLDVSLAMKKVLVWWVWADLIQHRTSCNAILAHAPSGMLQLNHNPLCPKLMMITWKTGKFFCVPSDKAAQINKVAAERLADYGNGCLQHWKQAIVWNIIVTHSIWTSRKTKRPHLIHDWSP